MSIFTEHKLVPIGSEAQISMGCNHFVLPAPPAIFWHSCRPLLSKDVAVCIHVEKYTAKVDVGNKE